MRMVELLPAPLGPRKPKASPCSTVKSTPSTAVKSPNRFTQPAGDNQWLGHGTSLFCHLVWASSLADSSGGSKELMGLPQATKRSG